MKTIKKIIALIGLFIVSISCAKQGKGAYEIKALGKGNDFFVSLKKPVLLVKESLYNLHWDSNIPEYEVSYHININGKLVKKHLTKTVISDNENLIEFNVPVTDFSIPFEMLETGNNTIQVLAQYSGEETYKSNLIEIIHSKSSFAVSK